MSEDALIVVGGPAVSEKDRLVSVDSLRPVQVLGGDKFTALDGFSLPTNSGMSNLVSVDGQLIWSSGDDLLVGSRHQHRSLPVADLADVHEITIEDQHILIANTRADEAIVLDRTSLKVIERLRPRNEGIHHLNQAFVGLDGFRYALVHHLERRQLRKRVAGRLLKVQGDGGVINLDTGELHDLRLTAPHSARLINGQTWILDSGRARVLIYDNKWLSLDKIALAGWGRGAAVSADGQILWVGLSPLRPRYQGFVEGPSIPRPAIVAIDITTRHVIQTVPVEGVDQINGVHLINRTQLELDEPAT